MHDYLGTPTQAYDSKGELVWEMLLDVYGRVAECHGDRTLVPFRYQGQYEDEETGLYYNRFRYYSPDMGMYISSDPIGLVGNNPTLYGYVEDVNVRIDPWGLDLHHIIPQQIYKEFKDRFKAISGYVQNTTKKAKDKTNLKSIDPSIHGNHPQYSKYVRQRISDLIAEDNLNIGQIRQLQDDLTECIDDAIAKNKRLNDYFADGDHIKLLNGVKKACKK